MVRKICSNIGGNGCGTRCRVYRSLRWLCRRPSRMRSFIGFDPVVGLAAAILPLVLKEA
jgi:hypothetical protein